MQKESNDRLENEFKEKPSYNDLYTKNKSVFGGAEGQPEEFVKYLGEELKAGLVLEVGAGQGRNALWLARRGVTVEASDISEVGLAQMSAIAHAESLPLHTFLADLRQPIVKKYDAIIGAYVFHHVPKDEAKNVLSDFQAHTKPGGYNVVAAFTQEGDFYRKNSATPYWYLESRELERTYADWEILRYEESVRKALAKKEDGTPMFNTVARILAKKR